MDICTFVHCTVHYTEGKIEILRETHIYIIQGKDRYTNRERYTHRGKDREEGEISIQREIYIYR